MDKSTKQSHSVASIFLIALMLASLGQVMSDLYLSSLPTIRLAFDTSTHRVQFTVSMFILGLAFSQLIYGPISDAYGRRKPLLFGLSISIIGSLICYLSPNIEVMILGRVIQGFGSGVGLALSRSILRDRLSGKALAKVGSVFAVGNIAIMTSSPFIGALLLTYIGWRANFAFLLIYAITTFLVVLIALPETNQNVDKDLFRPMLIKNSLKELFGSQTFIGFCLIITFTYSAIFAWITISPILLIHTLRMSPIYFGLANIGIGVIYAMTSLSNIKLLDRYSPSALIYLGLLLMLFGSLSLLATIIFHHWLAVIIPVYIFIAGTSYIFANGIAGALTPFPKIAGLASATLSFLEILGGALSSTAIASFGLDSQLWMFIFLMTLTSAAYIAKQIIFKI